MAAGLHNSTDDPPNTSMFVRAGGKAVQKNSQSQQVSQLLTNAATAITSANSSKSSGIPSSTAGTSTSPAKMIESRLKLYKQLSDLHNLHNIGILTNQEFEPITQKNQFCRSLSQATFLGYLLYFSP